MAFAGVRGHAFINFDDPRYVTHNPVVASGLSWTNVAWAFTDTSSGNWHPATWLSHMLDVRLFGMHAGAHHLMSLALHVANTLLLFLLFARTTASRQRAALVAALFAVHPLHVESVAWIAERKDVLSTFFWLLALIAYAGYAHRPSRTRYAVVAGLFAMGLLSKPMVVTLPVTLLIVDRWPLERAEPWWRLVIEKLPLFAMSAAATAVTFIAQRSAGAVATLDALGPGARASNATVSLIAYLEKTLVPSGLAPFYPHRAGVSIAIVASCALAAAAISAAAWMLRRRAPYLLAGWLWYVVTLLPVLGIIQVGGQAMADRYTYVPLIGIFAAMTWAVADLSARRAPLQVRRAVAVLTVAALALLTIRQVQHWRTAIDLWTHTTRVMPDNARAHNHLGQALLVASRPGEAERALRESIRLQPASADAHQNLGTALMDQGRDAEALPHYVRALAISPGYVEAHANMAASLARLGRFEQAIEHLRQAERLHPTPAVRASLAAAHNDAGVAADRQGRVGDALAHYRAAITASPSQIDAYVNMARLYLREGRDDDALQTFLAGLQADPRDADLHFGAGVIRARRGDLVNAARHFQAALASDPRHEGARGGLEAISRAAGAGR